MVINTEQLSAGTLCHVVQLRFTRGQYDLLEHVANETGMGLSPLLRNIVTVWAANHPTAAGEVDVEALVDELQALEAVA